MMVSLENVKANTDVEVYIKEADRSLEALGYTEHSFAHVTLVEKRSAQILEELGYDKREVELARIAAYLHDIGNVVNRTDHSQSGALMAFRILDKMGMDANEIAKIVSAIGNHDEGTGVPIGALAAALILADKSDVRRSRVRNHDFSTFDIHDRVNYSAVSSELSISIERMTVTLSLTIDTAISSIMDYFEIFLVRMKLCRSAASTLGLSFCLMINGQRFV